jgi:hypothetical protein
MIKCTGCKKTKPEEKYRVQKKSGEKILKKCFECREKCRLYKLNNKKRVSEYNKLYNAKTKQGREVDVVYGKDQYANEWIRYESQRDAARKLNLHAANINKVIKGSLDTTGGYIFKIEKEKFKSETGEWEDIKKDNDIVDIVKGKPSKHRKSHETVKGIEGKECSKCKKWNPLTNYNASNKRWDLLRAQCRDCLCKYRAAQDREERNRKYAEYVKKRKKKDPGFKLLLTLRSRLGNAITAAKGSKHSSTMELTGCKIKELKKHLEEQFTEDMTWENHGEWHVDHIIPCSAFDLTEHQHQHVCFNWRNLQPMWGTENLSKSNKYKRKDMIKLILKVNKYDI